MDRVPSRLTPLGLAALLLALPAAAAQSVGGQWDTRWQFDGQAAGDHLGMSVASAGDMDGDGFDDVIVGAIFADAGGLVNAGSAYVHSGATGILLWQFDGAESDSRFGFSVSGIADVDGDGVGDLLVGAASASPGSIWDAGSVFVYSGATGTMIRRLDGQVTFDNFGQCVSSARDIDGDGVDDFLVGAPRASQSWGYRAGAVYLYSGATGSLIRKLDGQANDDRFGGSVSGIGDIDGDGIGDLLIGAHFASPSGSFRAGSTYLYSGSTGSLIRRLDGQSAGESLGGSVSGIGDVDGDGVDDLLIGASGASPGGLTLGSAYVYSGATGNLIRQFDGQTSGGYFGSSVSRAGDVDGDGVDDIAIGASWASPGGLFRAGSADVYSGATGLLLHRFDGQAANEQLGHSVSAAGDIDGDGLGDVIVGALGASPGGRIGAGSSHVYSLDPFLHLGADEVSYSGNQPVQFMLDFPASEAGAHYAILLSISGTGPSVFNGIDIPLVQDAHFQQFLGNSTLLGTLNVNAQAQRSLRLHQQTQPGAIGKTIYLAAATFDTGTQTGRVSSIVRYLTVGP